MHPASSIDHISADIVCDVHQVSALVLCACVRVRTRACLTCRGAFQLFAILLRRTQPSLREVSVVPRPFGCELDHSMYNLLSELESCGMHAERSHALGMAARASVCGVIARTAGHTVAICCDLMADLCSLFLPPTCRL